MTATTNLLPPIGFGRVRSGPIGSGRVRSQSVSEVAVAADTSVTAFNGSFGWPWLARVISIQLFVHEESNIFPRPRLFSQSSLQKQARDEVFVFYLECSCESKSCKRQSDQAEPSKPITCFGVALNLNQWKSLRFIENSLNLRGSNWFKFRVIPFLGMSTNYSIGFLGSTTLPTNAQRCRSETEKKIF